MQLINATQLTNGQELRWEGLLTYEEHSIRVNVICGPKNERIGDRIYIFVFVVKFTCALRDHEVDCLDNKDLKVWLTPSKNGFPCAHDEIHFGEAQIGIPTRMLTEELFLEIKKKDTDPNLAIELTSFPGQGRYNPD